MRWTPNRILALYLGLGLFFLGILGLFAAPTMREGTWTFYKLDVVINLVHVVTGAIGILAVFTGWPRLYNQICGIFYILLGLLSLIPALYPSKDDFLGITHMNLMLNLTHLASGLIIIIFGFFISTYGSWRVATRAAM
jgi:uncharacterized membrane protein HdeD (DUF308 family)